MNYKKLTVLTLLLITGTLSFSQKLLTNNYKELLTDISAREFEVLDINDEPCAIIKIYSGLKNVKFDGNLGVEKVEQKEGQIWVWVPGGTRLLKISTDGFPMLPYQFPSSLKSSTVYALELSSDQVFPIIVSTGAIEADVQLGDKSYKTNSTIPDLPEGKYEITITKLGYKPITDSVSVFKGNVLFKYELEKTKQHVFKIRTQPKGAVLLMNGDYMGETDFIGHLYPGKYKIQISLKEFMPIDTTIALDPDKNPEISFQLVKNVGWINIVTTQPMVKLTLNGARIQDGKHQVDAGEMHEIIASKPYFHTLTEAVKLDRGQIVNKEITLKPVSGELSFVMEPDSIAISTLSNRNISSNWVGSTLKELPIGNYVIEIDEKGYYKKEVAFQIKDDERTNVNVILAERKFSPVAAGFASLFPGAGQYYTQRGAAGTLYMLATLAAAGGAAYYFLETESAATNYNDIRLAYLNEQNLGLIEQRRTEMTDAHNEFTDIAAMRDNLMMLAGGLYLANIIDAVVFAKWHAPSKRNAKKTKNTNVGFYGSPKGGGGVHLSYRF